MRELISPVPNSCGEADIALLSTRTQRVANDADRKCRTNHDPAWFGMRLDLAVYRRSIAE
jgi:hypothetical protein